MPKPGTFGQRLRALREDRGLSLHRLSLALYEADADKGRVYDASFISKIEKDNARPPTNLMVLLGEVLNPSKEELPEYHLAMMRRALDEREVGLDQALANLQHLDETATRADDLGGWLTQQGRDLEQALKPDGPAQTEKPKHAARQAKGH